MDIIILCKILALVWHDSGQALYTHYILHPADNSEFLDAVFSQEFPDAPETDEHASRRTSMQLGQVVSSGAGELHLSQRQSFGAHVMAEAEPAAALAMSCKLHQQLKDSGADALQAARLHSATNTRFVEVLVQLAQYKMSTAAAEEELGRAVLSAIESRRALLAVSYAALEISHPLLAEEMSGHDAGSEGLLRRLADDAESARARREAASGNMHNDDLSKMQEDQWQHHAVARDQARQDEVHLTELHLEGLRAKQRSIENALSNVGEHVPELPGLTVPYAVDAPLASAETHPLMQACADLTQSVHTMGGTCSESRAQVVAIIGRMAEEHSSRRRNLQAALQTGAADVRATRSALEAATAVHERRARAEALLASLSTLQAEVAAARKEERKARFAHDNLADEAAPGDPEVRKAKAKLDGDLGRLAMLSRRRDGVLAEVSALSAAPPATQGEVLTDDAAILLDFPELPLRAQRIVRPFQAYDELDAAGRARFDVEALLRRSGLLVVDRSYASYDDPLVVIDAAKTNVSCRHLRGAAHGAAPKVLKEFSVGEFKRIKRAIAAARHLQHPGVVPVECAFLEGGVKVVVQSRFFAGGNMRQWCRGKDIETRLRATQRVAEAVRFLHTNGVLHRDLKPENIVFDGNGPAAAPALCDFDLSVNTQETIASTMMRGTLLYLAPEAAPSEASDIFALGVTLLDVLFCDGDEGRLLQWVLGSTTLARPTLADLERVRTDLQRRTDDAECAALVRSMLSPQPADRPKASAVAEQLAELLDVRTCYVCHCPEPRDKGVECDAQARHFACDECFSLHLEGLEALCRDGPAGRIKCCASAFAGCTATFSFQTAAQHATPLAFDAVRKNADDLKQVELQGEFALWKERFETEFAAKSEEERRAIAARRHIEEMMDLHCPKCNSVFGQFTGCAALTCAYAGCNAHFCAFCLADCGSDAHPHVRACPLNPKRNEYFVDEATWARVVDGERRKKLQTYWATLGAGLQDALAAFGSVRQIFRDLRLDGQLGVAAFAEQMAQLRGMGFVDERAMRRALSEVGGNVEAALGMLMAR